MIVPLARITLILRRFPAATLCLLIVGCGSEARQQSGTQTSPSPNETVVAVPNTNELPKAKVVDQPQESTLARGDWPGFRGANVDGRSSGGILARTSEIGLQVRWKTKLGSGYSGVSVLGDRAVTMFTAGDSDFVVCLDAETGSELWRFRLGEKYVGHDGSFDGPVATPLLAADRVIALGPLGRLVALSLQDGSEIWSIDLVKDLHAAAPMYGFGASPILSDDLVLLQVGTPADLLYAFELETGRIRWSSGEDSASYQSPVPASLLGQEQLLVAGNSKFMGLNKRDGSILWEQPLEGEKSLGAWWSVIPVPMTADTVFLSGKGETGLLKIRYCVAMGFAQLLFRADNGSRYEQIVISYLSIVICYLRK